MISDNLLEWRYAVIGLGSMGKRRIRNLLALGVRPNQILGYDPRADRGKEAQEVYQVTTTSCWDDIMVNNPDIFIISTPPDTHIHYIRHAIELRKTAFIEASVISTGLPELDAAAKAAGVLLAPSCTSRFHPSVRLIKEIVSSNRYGKVCSFSYYMGQYLPDWHPWEDIRTFYAGKRETAGSREMVPFELTWLLDIVGRPKEVFGFFGMTHDMGVDIDDTYGMTMRSDSWIGCIMVDVVARYALRRLVLNLEQAQIQWLWEEKVVNLFDSNKKAWVRFYEPEGKAAIGYNTNIIEEMYIDEMRSYLDAVKGLAPFPNTLADDIAMLSILESVELTNAGRAISST